MNSLSRLLVSMFFCLIAYSMSVQYVYANSSSDSLISELESAKTTLQKGTIYLQLAGQYVDDIDKCEQYAHQAVSMCNNAGDPSCIAKGLGYLAYVFQIRGKIVESDTALDKAITLFSKEGDSLQLAEMYLIKAANYSFFGKEDDAIGLKKRSLAIAQKYEDDEHLAESYLALAHSYILLGKSDQALRYALDGLRSAKNIKGDLTNVAAAYATLVSVYANNGKSEKALAYSEKELLTQRELGSKIGEQRCLLNMGSILCNMNRTEEGLKLYYESLDLLDTANQKENVAILNLQIGIAHDILGQFGEAHTSLLKAKNKYVELGYTELLSYIYLQLGITQMHRKKYSSAEAYFDNSINAAKSAKSFSDQKEAYRMKSQLYSLLGKHKQALEYMEMSFAAKDSVINEASERAMIEMQTKYETENKDLQIKVLQKQSELNQKQAAKHRLLIFGSLGLALLVGAFGFQTIHKNKLKQRLKMERFRNKIAADLHDDVGSTLSSISMYSEVILQKTKDLVPETAPMLSNMAANSREIVEAMGDIVWTINPNNNTINSLVSRIRSKTASLCEAKEVRFKCNNDDITEVKMNLEAAQNVYLVLKESINNALKYSECKNLTLDTKVDGKVFYFSVSDDGKGFEVSSKSAGNGMRTMRERMLEIGGELSVKSSSDGTMVNGEVNL